ncbi:MAG: RNA methyltransferase [Anaerolineales bacterium]|nr:RNA methyltransferase [Anaerolineales bacterium]
MITSASNPRVKWVRGLQTRRSSRSGEAAYVVEGERMAREVLASGKPASFVFYTEHLDARGRGLVNSLQRIGAAAEPVSDAAMAAMSATESPPGLLLVLPIPEAQVQKPLTLAVVADRLANPGNLGTLMRTCRAAGVQALFLSEGTVDAYNPKVVRGAMGAHLHLPIVRLSDEATLRQLDGVPLWLAEARQGAVYHQVDWRAPVALVIGSEATGTSDAFRESAQGTVHIPLSSGSESLNAAVAAAVILFEIARQRGPT